jgi:hypothetical protein
MLNTQEQIDEILGMTVITEEDWEAEQYDRACYAYVERIERLNAMYE